MTGSLRRVWRSLVEQRGYVSVVVVLTASLSANVYLAHQLRLREQPVVREAGVAAGSQLPWFAGKSLTGGDLEIRFDSPTMLYLFSPRCEWCASEHANLVAIARQASTRYRVVGMTRIDQGLESYLTRYPFPGDVIVVDGDFPDPAINRDLGLTPQLLLVDTGGAVKRAWPGALLERKKLEVENFFDMALPGAARDSRQQE